MTTGNSPTVIEKGGLWGARLLSFETLPSSNLWSLENIAGLRHGDVVLVKDQTAGRGRFGRKWVSAAGQSLTMSAILDPSGDNEFLVSQVTRILAVSTARMLERFGINAQLKWPNDVLVAGKKISGILAERSGGDGMIVAGIGINVNMTKRQLGDRAVGIPATSILLETGKRADMAKVLELLLRMIENMTDLARSKGLNAIHTLWHVADYLEDRILTIHTERGEFAGRYAGTDKEGRLRLTESRSGREMVFPAGDVTVHDEYGTGANITPSRGS